MSSSMDALTGELVAETRAARELLGRAELSPQVLEAIQRVPRDRFVPPSHRALALANRALPIGYGQTISQPFVVAVMTDVLGLGPDHRVLEVGTGCGYQTAVLAELVKEVYSIEIIPELARAAAERLKDLGYKNVWFGHQDGYLGWPEHAPYDAIIVTACAPEIPQPLVDQLKVHGRLVIPVGGPGAQWLILVHKTGEDGFQRKRLLPVAFVPLIRGP